MVDATKVVRPHGTVEDDMGAFNWFMDNDRIMVKVGNLDSSINAIEINRVQYRGDAHVRLKDGKWQALYNEIWLRRVDDFMNDPTPAAWNAFRSKVEEIAESVATPENLRLAKIYGLEAEIVDSQEKILSLEDDIRSEQESIAECRAKLWDLAKEVE